MMGSNFALQKKFCPDIREICQPIFDLFQLNFFSHTRISRDGQFFSLMTYPELTEFYLQMKYPIAFSDGKRITLNSGYYFTILKEDQKIENKIRQEFYERFNISYLFYVVEKFNHYDELYAFATTPDNSQIFEKYINNIDILKHFILYYKDKSSYLMKKIKGIKHSTDLFKPAMNHSNMSVRELKKCKQQMEFKKIHIDNNAGNLIISKREYECLQLLKKHHTQKEIAKQLLISPRTVETYLNSLKNKLNCEKTSELIAFFEKYNLN